jgi:plastocyanin
MQSRTGHLWKLALAIGFSVGWAPTLDLKAETSQNKNAATSISGTVSYQTDAQRPWRFGRYYIKGKDKHLAEAVVELIPVSPNTSFPDQISRTPKTYLMDQENFMFIPETLAVQLGDKVRFKNSEEAFHNVMCLDDKPPFNVNLAKGQEYIHEPKVADGTLKPLNIRCVFHGSMKGWLVVVPHQHYKLTDASGAFQFKDFPAGTYKLRVIHPAGDLVLETDAREITEGGSIQWNIALSPDHLRKTKQ